MSDFTIQMLSQGEGPRLRKIRLRALQNDPDAFSSSWGDVSQWPPERWTTQIKEMTTLVAAIETAQGSRDVGMVRSAHDTTNDHVRWLISMWTAPDARRIGIGTALILQLIEHLKLDSALVLRLDVAQHNTGASALYKRMGFLPTGVVYTLPAPRHHITEIQYELTL